jgi:hypothetical protein
MKYFFAAFLWMALSVTGAFAQNAPLPQNPAQTGAPQQAPVDDARRKAWNETMSRTPKPKEGCFTSAYPSTEWKEVPCITPLPRPYQPASGPRPQTVGNGTDWTAKSGTGPISTAVGSFDSVSGVTTVTDSASGNANTFSLQLNTNTFNTSTLGCNRVPNCVGWQQFIFSTDGCTSNTPCVFIQYWLINFGPTCPSPWLQTPLSPNNCYQNSPKAASVPAQIIAGLANMILTGTAASGGNDTATMLVDNPPTLHFVSNTDSVVNLAQGWTEAEFNIFGDCCQHQANFNSGSTLVVRTSVDAGARLAPTCVETGFTGETNNLTLVGTPAVVPTTPLPAIVFTESNAGGGTPPTCATSRGGLICIGVASSGSTTCTDSGGVASTCASARCAEGLTLTGGGGACAAGDRKIKSLFPRASNRSFNIMCEQQGVDPQAVAICCRL